jgi:hypothetical protein
MPHPPPPHQGRPASWPCCSTLLDSLDGVAIFASERANIATVMNQARTARPTMLDRDAPVGPADDVR